LTLLYKEISPSLGPEIRRGVLASSIKIESTSSTSVEEPEQQSIASEDEAEENAFASEDDTAEEAFASEDEAGEDAFASEDDTAEDAFASEEEIVTSDDEAQDSIDSSFATASDESMESEEPPPSDKEEYETAPFELSEDATIAKGFTESTIAALKVEQEESESTEIIDDEDETEILEDVDLPSETNIPEKSTLATSSEDVTPETFNDIKEFSQSIHYGEVKFGGNPPFSIIIKNVRYQEDANDIMIILREHGLVNDQTEEDYTRSISHGSLLVSQLSEYAAIYLSHRLRRFDIEILMGLSDELHPPKNASERGRGLVNKNILYQNRKDYIRINDSQVPIENIILSTTSLLESYTINKYLGLANEHSLLDLDDLTEGEEESEFSQEFMEQIEDTISQIDEEHSPLVKNVSLPEVYINLANKLKEQALKLKGNAVIGINYQLTPLVENYGIRTKTRYRVTCTGNVVWAMKI